MEQAFEETLTFGHVEGHFKVKGHLLGSLTFLEPSVHNTLKSGITLLHVGGFRPNLDGTSFLRNHNFGHVEGHFKFKGHLQGSMNF